MEYFPTKAPAFCKTWYDLSETWVSGLGQVSREAHVLRELHVKTCEQCKAAQQSVHLTPLTPRVEPDPLGMDIDEPWTESP